MKIIVYENSFSDKVKIQFNNIIDLLKYNDNIEELNADQISIDDRLMMGWDEIMWFEKLERYKDFI